MTDTIEAHFKARGIEGAIELLEIAESANPPRDGYAIDADWTDRIFPAKDGWQVEFFYDGYELDYIEAFIAPTGERFDFWDWEPCPARQFMTTWCSVGDLERLRGWDWTYEWARIESGCNPEIWDDPRYDLDEHERRCIEEVRRNPIYVEWAAKLARAA